jgi:hypothetical protein
VAGPLTAPVPNCSPATMAAAGRETGWPCERVLGVREMLECDGYIGVIPRYPWWQRPESRGGLAPYVHAVVAKLTLPSG